MKPTLLFILILFVTILSSCSSNDLLKIDLSGEWQFRMDPKDQGIDEHWFEKELSETVLLPGSMVENGKGYDITLETEWIGGVQNPDWIKDPNYAPYVDQDDIRFPYWLQPEKKFTGAAWYIKKVTIPDTWEGKTAKLKLERPHWESQVWINGQWVEMQNSLAVPHVFDISGFFKTGENTIAIRIDNRIKEIDPGQNSHSISDHTQSNWNGIVGNILLEAKGNIIIENVEVFPDVASKTTEIKATVNNRTTEIQKVDINAFAILKSSGKKLETEEAEFTLSPGKNIVSMNYLLGDDALLWDEFNPNVYRLDLALKSGEESDQASVDFGLREFGVDGTRFAINGRPVFLRGTLECAIFPLTGYPSTDTDYWRKIYTAVKDHGLNHVRFHSWCPPEAAFEVADEMGVYLQVECSSWANESTQLGSGFPIDQYIWDESKRIVEKYGNHPSFVMMAYGNEPGGPNHIKFLTDFVSYWKEEDNRRVYTSAAGWPAIEVNQYHDIPHPRIQGWGEELNSIINSEAPTTSYDWSDKVTKDGTPVVSHEIGQWCVYPNFKEIEKYSGVLKPKNFEIFRESLEAHHMGQLADSFLLASGKLQALCYKADIEAALRTPGFAGFQLLDLHDFPGQGTALVGVLDPFWEEKGYISPEEYRRFCNTTVPLARLEKRIFNEGETMTAKIEVAHFGEHLLNAATPSWHITRDSEIVARGTLEQRDIPVGNGILLGKVVYEFQRENTPRKLTLKVEVGGYENSWDIWVYPENEAKETETIRIVEKLNTSTIDYLENGGKVLLNLGKGKVTHEMGGEVGVGFSSIFWNTAWTLGQKPHTLGILCNPDHPALHLFPTEYHSNWQWWDAMSHADAIQLDSFPTELKPIVQIVDDWVTNRRLALLFEAKVGKGKLLISGIDLHSELETRPEARQLLFSLKNYMLGDDFNPTVSVTSNKINNIIK
ncbi:sugar-binding domain-containing protein [Maribellus maritimus]|uniref:sugar-binding domain-containing protein n=1 Tax=Maribellus maritimus TaxID=2870838 RepID=UPI001EE9EADD|nr:sugar-binding domain-containing protein [Maribellus maritimus]MCG6189546.1 beta-glucuronidase [Maribellus maritimus]